MKNFDTQYRISEEAFECIKNDLYRIIGVKNISKVDYRDDIIYSFRIEFDPLVIANHKSIDEIHQFAISNGEMPIKSDPFDEIVLKKSFATSFIKEKVNYFLKLYSRF